MCRFDEESIDVITTPEERLYIQISSIGKVFNKKKQIAANSTFIVIPAEYIFIFDHISSLLTEESRFTYAPGKTIITKKPTFSMLTFSRSAAIPCLKQSKRSKVK